MKKLKESPYLPRPDLVDLVPTVPSALTPQSVPGHSHLPLGLTLPGSSTERFHLAILLELAPLVLLSMEGMGHF